MAKEKNKKRRIYYEDGYSGFLDDAIDFDSLEESKERIVKSKIWSQTLVREALASCNCD